MTTLQGALLHKHSEPQSITDTSNAIAKAMGDNYVSSDNATHTLTFQFNQANVTLQLEERSELMTYLTLKGNITEEDALILLTQCIACTGRGFIYDPHSTQQPRKRTVVKKNHQLRKNKFETFASQL